MQNNISESLYEFYAISFNTFYSIMCAIHKNHIWISFSRMYSLKCCFHMRAVSFLTIPLEITRIFSRGMFYSIWEYLYFNIFQKIKIFQYLRHKTLLFKALYSAMTFTFTR